jgi:ABC-2 type transport system ATP-binding protein
MAAVGSVETLRAGGPRRLWIEPEVSGRDWLTGLDGVSLVRAEGRRLLLELAKGTDDQTILRAALEAGPVHEFRTAVASLAEIFRSALEGNRP